MEKNCFNGSFFAITGGVLSPRDGSVHGVNSRGSRRTASAPRLLWELQPATKQALAHWSMDPYGEMMRN